MQWLVAENPVDAILNAGGAADKHWLNVGDLDRLALTPVDPPERRARK